MSVLAEPPRIDLTHSGVSEATWVPLLRALPGRRPAALFAAASRMVVVTPHPDDETLGVGGIIAAMAGAGLPVTVVSVTDGEAASRCPDSARDVVTSSPLRWATSRPAPR